MILVADLLRSLRLTGPLASFCVVLALLVSGCSQRSAEQVFSGATMGTHYNVKVIGDVAEGLGERIQAELDAVDRAMTTYDPDSELNRLNATPVGESMPLSPPLAEVLDQAWSVYRLTDGAFDPTVGPLVDLWGFGPEYQGDRVPSEDEIGRLLGRVGYGRLRLSTKGATRNADIRLDLSAIAKGYGVDRVAQLLDSEDVGNYLVEVGGEMRLSGVNAEGGPWRVAIETPDPLGRSVHRVMSVTNAAVATSGNYRNFFEINGRRYSHTLDPRTGYPVDHQLASVTVVDDNAARADALATAFAVMGPDAALTLATRADIAVFLLVKDNDGLKEQFSPAFEPYLKEAFND